MMDCMEVVIPIILYLLYRLKETIKVMRNWEG